MAMEQYREEKDSLPKKSYRTILHQEITAGLVELRRPAKGLFLSSLSAGLDLGFSLLLMATMLSGVLVSENLVFMDFLRFLVLSVVGNTIGGVIFVALIKYGHAINSNEGG